MTTNKLVRHLMVFGLVLSAGLGSGAGLVTLQRHHELKVGLDIVTPPPCRSEANTDSCQDALADPAWGSVLGAPVAAWGAGAMLVALLAALALAGALTWRREGMTEAALAALFVMALVLAGGTLLFLVVGLLVLGVKCGLCLTMHAINGLFVVLVAASVLSLWRADFRAGIKRWSGRGAALFALLAMVGLTFVTDAVEAGVQSDLAAQSKALDADYGRLLERACPSLPCPAETVFPLHAMPGDHESIVLAEGKAGTTLVEMLDLSCEACAEQHRYLEPLYRGMVDKNDMGLRLVLYAANRECNPLTKRRLHYHACASNGGLICAHRAGGSQKALDYMKWEFSVGRQTHTLPDRLRWLEQNVSTLAASCLREELSNGTDGRLAKHARAGHQLKKRAADRALCGEDGPGWWCFNGTPAFGVFTSLESRSGKGTSAARAVDASLRTRAQYLRGCPPP